MPTPAKKAVPSLSDLVGKDDSKEDSKTAKEESKDVNTPETIESEENKSVDVQQPGKPVDKQAGKLHDNDKDDFVNPDGVTLTGGPNVINKTPADMSAETAEESAKRFGISDEIPEDVANNPNVQFYGDNKNYQIPGGTHLHPDVARDNYNRSLDPVNHSTQSSRVVTELVFASEAEVDDKGRKNAFHDETGTDVE